MTHVPSRRIWLRGKAHNFHITIGECIFRKVEESDTYDLRSYSPSTEIRHDEQIDDLVKVRFRYL